MFIISKKRRFRGLLNAKMAVRTCIVSIALIGLAHVAANAQPTIICTTPTSLPITCSGTVSAAAPFVGLQIIQDPGPNVPPAGTQGALNLLGTNRPFDPFINPILRPTATTWTATLNLLNGPYRLIVFDFVGFPASIDITVNVPNNPDFMICSPAIQTGPALWSPVALPGFFPVAFYETRRAVGGLATAPDFGRELDKDPTNYAVDTEFTCTQNTNGRIPRFVTMGGDPVISPPLVGWSFDPATSTLTIKMKSAGTFLHFLPHPPIPLISSLTNLSVIYDFPAEVTGSYIASNASFWRLGATFVDRRIEELFLTMENPSGSTAFFEAFVSQTAFNEFFVPAVLPPGVPAPTCADITVEVNDLPFPATVTPVVQNGTQLGCRLRIETTFASEMTAEANLTKKGDANRDKIINVIDARITLQAALGLVSPHVEIMKDLDVADPKGPPFDSTRITIDDAKKIAGFGIGLVPSLNASNPSSESAHLAQLQNQDGGANGFDLSFLGGLLPLVALSLRRIQIRQIVQEALKMSRNKIFFIASLLAALAFMLTACGVQPPPAGINVVIDKLSLATGDSAEVAISVTEMPGGGIASIQVGPNGFRYDPKVIRVKSIRGLNGFQILASEFNNTTGQGRFVAANPTGGVANGPILAILVEGVGGGSSALQFIKATMVLGDTNNASITVFNTIDGQVNVGFGLP